MIDLLKIAKTEADGKNLKELLSTLYKPSKIRPKGYQNAIIWEGGNFKKHINPVAHSFTDAYGFDLIILTIIVKTALYPLTMQQMRNQRLMQKMAPELKKLDPLKNKNPQEYQQKTMDLYKLLK